MKTFRNDDAAHAVATINVLNHDDVMHRVAAMIALSAARTGKRQA